MFVAQVGACQSFEKGSRCFPAEGFGKGVKRGLLWVDAGGGFGLSVDLTERLVCLAGCAVLYPP